MFELYCCYHYSQVFLPQAQTPLEVGIGVIGVPGLLLRLSHSVLNHHLSDVLWVVDFSVIQPLSWHFSAPNLSSCSSIMD